MGDISKVKIGRSGSETVYHIADSAARKATGITQYTD